jgi:hypothetical protein
MQEPCFTPQLTATSDAVARGVGAFLLGTIDEEGSSRGDPEEAMATGADLATVERLWATIQIFEPHRRPHRHHHDAPVLRPHHTISNVGLIRGDRC